MLSKITVFGRLCYDPDSGKSYWDATAPCIFNERGFPDCLDNPITGEVAFAPCARYGYKTIDGSGNPVETIVEPVAGAATKQARSWTCGDVITYLRNYCTNSQIYPQIDYGNMQLSQFLSWDASLSTVFGTVRTVNNFDINNQSILRALSMTVRKAGAYDIYCEPTGLFGSRLSVVNMNPQSGYGVSFYLPNNNDTIDSLMFNPLAIRTGHVRESANNYFDNVSVIGDAPAVERFVSTSNSGVNLATAAGDKMIEYAWDTSDLTNFQNFIKNYNLNPDSHEAFLAASECYPWVLCTYRIKKGTDIWQNTRYAGLMNGGSHPRIRPNLLSAKNMSETNPRNWDSMPIEICEIEQTNNQGDWQPVSLRGNAVKVSPDAEFIFIDLRDADPASATWYQTSNNANGKNYYHDGITPRNIRLTLAVEGDFALCGRNTDDPNNTGSRVIAQNFTFATVANQNDYVDWFRNYSFPHGIARLSSGSNWDSYPDAELYSDITRINNHAKLRCADIKRVEISGTLILACVNPSLKPGMSVSIVGSNVIPTYSVIKAIAHDAANNETRVELTSADMSTIYDMPSPMSGSYNAGGSGQGGGGSKDTSDYPLEGQLKQDKYKLEGGLTSKDNNAEHNAAEDRKYEAENNKNRSHAAEPIMQDASEDKDEKGSDIAAFGNKGQAEPPKAKKDYSQLSADADPDKYKLKEDKKIDGSKYAPKKFDESAHALQEQEPEQEKEEPREMREYERSASSESRLNPAEKEGSQDQFAAYKAQQKEAAEQKKYAAKNQTASTDIHGGTKDRTDE